MKSKIIQTILVCFFVIFSFFYTNKAVDFIKNIDPIMKEIKTNKEKYEIKSVNATITKDEIIPGYTGLKIDINKSYNQMKKMNKYNPNYLIYEESVPTITINNNYKKYIVAGNYLKNSVSLIFKINKDSKKIPEIYNYLENKNAVGTFFIDGVYIEKNKDIIYNLAEEAHEVEILSYNNELEEEKLTLTKNTLKNTINYEGKYCLTTEKKRETLDLCSKNHMYTIKPSFELNSFSDLKNNLESGVIIDVNLNRVNELNTIINYIRQKGYTIVSLEELLSEFRTTEK